MPPGAQRIIDALADEARAGRNRRDPESRKGINAARAATEAALDAWEPSDEPTRERLLGLRALLTFWRAVGHLDIPVDYEVPIGGHAYLTVYVEVERTSEEEVTPLALGSAGEAR